MTVILKCQESESAALTTPNPPPMPQTHCHQGAPGGSMGEGPGGGGAQCKLRHHRDSKHWAPAEERRFAVSLQRGSEDT